MEKTGTPQAAGTPPTLKPTPSVKEIFEDLAILGGTKECLQMIDDFYESYLYAVDNGLEHGNENFSKYLFIAKFKQLFVQAQKEYQLLD